MSKNPTIAQLVAAALVAAPSVTAEFAKELINSNKLRSFKRVTETFAELEVKATPAKKAKEPKAKAPARIRSERIIEAGPRGFRFGEVWNMSVKAGTGVALNPSNINKLKAHAATLGLSTKGDAAAMAAAVAAAM